jgi:hypothetical protein
MEYGTQMMYQDNQDNVSIEDLYEEMYRLRERVAMMEDENLRLRSKLNETQSLKIQLENTLLLQNDDVSQEKEIKNEKREYKRKELSSSAKALKAFYVENKSNPLVLKKVSEKMSNIGFIVRSNKDLPSQLVKLECDLMFNTLANEFKNKYIL